MYSHLYRCHGRNQEHLAVATKAFKFLTEHWHNGKDDKGHYSWAVEAGRSGASETIQPFSPLSIATSGYGGAFIAEGMAEYYRASGDDRARDLAITELRRFVDLIDNPSHDSDTHLQELVTGSHCLGHSMIMLSLSRQMLATPSIFPDDSDELKYVKEISDRAVVEVDVKFLHPEYQLLSECLSADYHRLDDSNEDFVYLGHGM